MTGTPMTGSGSRIVHRPFCRTTIRNSGSRIFRRPGTAFVGTAHSPQRGPRAHEMAACLGHLYEYSINTNISAVLPSRHSRAKLTLVTCEPGTNVDVFPGRYSDVEKLSGDRVCWCP